MSQKPSSNGIDGSDSAALAGEVHKRHDVVQEDFPDGRRGDRGGEGDAGEVAEDWSALWNDKRKIKRDEYSKYCKGL